MTRRLIIVAYEEGSSIEVDYDGEWDSEEARMVLREAVEVLSEQIEEESE